MIVTVNRPGEDIPLPGGECGPTREIDGEICAPNEEKRATLNGGSGIGIVAKSFASDFAPRAAGVPPVDSLGKSSRIPVFAGWDRSRV